MGSLSFVVLGIGSVNPGLLQFAIDKFSQVRWQAVQGSLMHGGARIVMHWGTQ